MSGSLENLIKAQAFGLGFDLVGITSLGKAETSDAFERWLDNGYHADMHYMERGREKRRDTRLPFTGVKSAIVVVMNYGGTQKSGAVARYARGRDYHDVIGRKLRALHVFVEKTAGRTIRGKPYVDTGPLLERDLARKAGLGWFGKNSNLINPRIGSFFFIGSLLLDLELVSDEPFAKEHCGSCTRCIEACPTNAIVADGVVDARRCISWQTIENRGAITQEMRAAQGSLIYGCDICQDVCPWNVRFSRDPTVPELEPDPELTDPDLSALLLLTEEEFGNRFKGSPVTRARRSGFVRNVAVALGNVGAKEDKDALERALASESDPVVREHVVWAWERRAESGEWRVESG